MSYTVMHAPNHGPTVTKRIFRRALRQARRSGARTISTSEFYHLWRWGKHRPGWACIIADEKPMPRRGANDNPLFVRRKFLARRHVLERITVKGAKGVRLADGTMSRVAPERWIQGAVTQEDIGKVLHLCVHPHAGVVHQTGGKRLRQYRAEWRIVMRIVREMRAKYGDDLHVIITGDFNAPASWQDPYGPSAVAKTLDLNLEYHGIDGVMFSKGLSLASSPRLIPEAQQGAGQDHPWLIFNFN